MQLQKCVQLCATLIIFLSSFILTTAWVDYDLVNVETLNNTKEPMEYKITKKRIDRFTFVIDGTVAFTDLTGYEAELKIYHSAPDSSKFVLSPFKLPRIPIDKALNNDYRKYLMNQVHEFSDLPYSEDETEDIYPKFLVVPIGDEPVVLRYINMNLYLVLSPTLGFYSK
ncbi:hypothetical protein Bhyg_09702 [Pseudolycoriella hygida]|uniref:Uncharacterized protein n=1 Tax=Pseudolycoriella hygida TaxID=35572 RepID=A0A9Q0RYB5_9DIPT|nr:hypothetical protein Bhyg_09702 [Pseudolycoriella hygida]